MTGALASALKVLEAEPLLRCRIRGFEGGFDFARLVGRLEVDAEVETGLEEVDTGRIGVDTVQVDVGVLCGVAQEGDALVGVGEIATGHHAQGAAEQHGRQLQLFFMGCVKTW